MKIKTLFIVIMLLFFATGCYQTGYHPTYIISEEDPYPAQDSSFSPK